ncbi:MAG: acetyltransferase [Bacteroidota bacterium]|jgi:acetyltransferase-like isoleucine patch superfamily enzyme
MKNLIIIGARGFGREIYNVAIQTKEYNTKWTIGGFLDNKKDALDGFKGYPQILSSVEDYEVQENDLFICALGDVKYKKKYVSLILGKGGKFINIIHPTSIININVKLGIGVIICPFTYISNDVTIGNFTTIQTHSAIGHDVQIGDYCQINALTFLGGFAEIKEGATMNPGSGVVPRGNIGENTIVGINSTVLKNTKPNSTVYGNPAKEIL